MYAVMNSLLFFNYGLRSVLNYCIFKSHKL